MDFLCPSCQKMLTVPDQYAGTLMKCPLCANTFQAPALPSAQPPLPPPGPFPAPPPPSRQSDTAFAPSPPSAAPQPSPARTPPPPPPSAGEYQHAFGLALDPRVVQWIPPAALLLVFLLQLFTPWVGMYPGGYPAYTQGVGGAAFGWYGTASNPVWEKIPEKNSHVPAVILPGAKQGEKGESLGWFFPMMVYVFPIFPLALVLAIAAAVLPLVQARAQLPPFVDQIKPWRWAIAGGAALLALLLLLVPLVFGFSLENKVKEKVETEFLDKQKEKVTTDEDRQLLAMARGSLVGAQELRRTVWLQLVFWLQVLAVVAAAVQFWLDFRGPRPAPRLDIRA
jgi:hypothetical protein